MRAIMLDRVESNTLRQLFLYWDEKRGQRRAPPRDEIDPAGMFGFLPNVFLIDVEAEPRRYRVRLMGTILVNWYGQDVTGRYIDEITDQVLGALGELVTSWRPWSSRRSAGISNAEYGSNRVRSSGDMPGYILGSLMPGPPARPAAWRGDARQVPRLRASASRERGRRPRAGPAPSAQPP